MLDYLEFDSKVLNTFKPSICNRLDRNTSGLMVCGKTLEGLRVNNELIKTKAVSKYYLAVVKGRVENPVVLMHGFIRMKRPIKLRKREVF